jgi:hypothetical protein
MSVLDNARNVLSDFLGGASKKLRVDIENKRTNSPNTKNTKRIKFVDKSKVTHVDGSTNNGLKIDNLSIDTLNVKVSGQEPYKETDVPEPMQLLQKAFKNGEISFVTENEQQRLNDALSFERKPEIAAQLRYFKPRLSTRDFSLMRTGFYLRHLKQVDPAKVSAEWSNIQMNTDRSERKVINLASAGYFESYFRPLASAYDKKGKSCGDFQKQFEKTIDDMHFVVFVSKQMSVGALVGQVIDKAKRNIKYRVKDDIIYLHAMGHQSISIVNDSLPELRKHFRNIRKASMNRNIRDDSIKYKVYYKNNNFDD